jgi:hypothetical protein
LSDSEIEVDPQAELGTHIIFFNRFFSNQLFFQTTSRSPGAPPFILFSNPTYLFNITMADSAISSPAHHESARQLSEASAAFKTRKTRPRLQTFVTTPFAVSAKTL